MADVLTAEQRSRCMSRIRGRDTGPELRVRSGLWRRALRFRTRTRLPGRPDVVFPTERVAVFIDGCFWHACRRHGVMPKTNTDFWKQKIADNVRRDRRNTRHLSADGWVVLRFWEHQVRNDLDAVLDRVQGRVVERRSTMRKAMPGVSSAVAARRRRAARHETR